MATIIIIICAAALVAFALSGTIKKMRGKSKSSCCGTPEVKNVKKVEDTDESHYPYRYNAKIEGMQCSNCARTVENALNGIEGVWSSVDLGRNKALIRSKQERTEKELDEAISEKGFHLILEQ